MSLTGDYNFFAQISALSLLAPLIILLINRASNDILKALFFYISFSMLTEALFYLFPKSDIISIYLPIIFTFAEGFSVTYIYYLILESNEVLKFCLLTILIFLFFLFILSLYSSIISRALTFFEFLIICIFGIYYMAKMNKGESSPRLFRFLWLNLAFLIYFGSSFLLLIFQKELFAFDKESATILWYFHLLVNVAYNLLLAVGIWRIRSISF